MEYVRIEAKNVQQMIAGVRSEMFDAMKECIEQGMSYATREFKVGGNFVIIEIPAWEPVSKEHVVILHENHQHESPLLEEKIASELCLNWSSADNEVAEERETEDSYREWLWRCLRYQ